jgi:hypothetical protein
MDRFNEIIESLPATQFKIGTILLETATIKKMLIDMPKQIIDSIRHSVTQTMDSETKLLREELSHASEVLNQLPSKLETYTH